MNLYEFNCFQQEKVVKVQKLINKEKTFTLWLLLLLLKFYLMA